MQGRGGGRLGRFPGPAMSVPLPTFRPLEEATRRRAEPALAEESEAESEIWYPTAPPTVSWPRVFPQL
jgi:hypothetical protein